jgi:hypothetical protein
MVLHTNVYPSNYDHLKTFFLAKKFEYLWREVKLFFEKIDFVSVKIKYEKDVGCKRYCYFGEIFFLLPLTKFHHIGMLAFPSCQLHKF